MLWSITGEVCEMKCDRLAFQSGWQLGGGEPLSVWFPVAWEGQA